MRLLRWCQHVWEDEVDISIAVFAAPFFGVGIIIVGVFSRINVVSILGIVLAVLLLVLFLCRWAYLVSKRQEESNQ